MPALGEWQYALDDFVFGYGTRWPVYGFDVDFPELSTQDRQNPREDGISMGVDRMGSMLISMDLEVEASRSDENEAMELLAQIRGEWYGTRKRLEPQGYQVLSYRTGGSGEQRRVYGRGRVLTPATLENVHTGLIPCSAQFVCASPYFYSDAEFSDRTPLIPEAAGGLVLPSTMPFVMSGAGGSGSRGFQVGGYEPAWLSVRINGPVLRPIIEVVDQYAFQLDVSIPPGDAVIVDPQPWSRTVRRASDGANLSGLLTGNSAWLADMRVAPGFHEIVMRGHDPTGSSSVEVYWRTVRASL